MIGGDTEQKKRWLPELAKGKGFSYCLSESEAGSDAAALKTKAEKTSNGWLLNGSKKWISNAGVSEFYTVIAQTDPSKGSKGITAFIVEKSDPGISFGAPEKKMGFRGSPTREVYFDNVEISDDRRIGEVGKGFAIAMDTLDHTRITIAAQHSVLLKAHSMRQRSIHTNVNNLGKKSLNSKQFNSSLPIWR